MTAQEPSVAAQETRWAAIKPVLAALGPFEPILALSKTWHVLHYLLTGHADAGESPGDAILTGTPLGSDLGYGPPQLHDASETRAFRDFLAPLDASRLLTRMDFAQMRKLGIYPLVGEPDTEEIQSWRDEVAGIFPKLKAYVDQAWRKGDGLLVWLS